MNVEGATHKQVVDQIKSCGDSLTLTVISVTLEEADRLEPTGKLPLNSFRGSFIVILTFHVHKHYEVTYQVHPKFFTKNQACRSMSRFKKSK